jgi:hypothetical protein
MNNPLNGTDPTGGDVIWLCNTQAVLGAGHISLLIECADGQWMYFYWGLDTHVEKFNTLDDFFASGTGADYTDDGEATRITGDFSKLEALAEAVASTDDWWKGVTVGGIKLSNFNYHLTKKNCLQISLLLLLSSSSDSAAVEVIKSLGVQISASILGMSRLGGALVVPVLANEEIKKSYGTYYVYNAEKGYYDQVVISKYY